MAYKQNIPDAWKKMRPNTAKIPFIYNLDASVGYNSPNRRLDVMLIQYMLLAWELRSGAPGQAHYTPMKVGALRFDPLPVNGSFDHRTLGWIYYYQLANTKGQDAAAISGTITPAAADGSSLDGKHLLLRLNMLLADPSGAGQFRREFLDFSLDPMAPAELVQALKVAK